MCVSYAQRPPDFTHLTPQSADLTNEMLMLFFGAGYPLKLGAPVAQRKFRFQEKLVASMVKAFQTPELRVCPPVAPSYSRAIGSCKL